MKKYISMLLLLCLIFLSATGCSKNETSQIDGNKPETQVNSAVTGNSDSDSNKTQEKPVTNGKVDVDLTVLSSTVVYAEVYNIMKKPDDYMGKTIKMSGPYYASYYDETDQYYHYVIIEDAAACCQQGLEFIWNGEHAYPDDYPEEQSRIEVVGEFRSYEELGQTYYYLAVDDISEGVEFSGGEQ